MTHAGDCVTRTDSRCSWLPLDLLCPSSSVVWHSQPDTHCTSARPIFSYDLPGRQGKEAAAQGAVIRQRRRVA